MAGVTTPAVRYPFEPLHRLVAVRVGLPYCPGYRVDPATQAHVVCGDCAQKIHCGPAAAARYLGVSTSAPQRWREEGGIPEPTADMIVLGIKLHPVLIDGWRDLWLGSVQQSADRGECEPLDRDDPWLLQTELFPGMLTA